MELYIIRHGQSTNNALQDQSARTHDPALTPLGFQQAEALAAFLCDAPRRDPWTDPATGYTVPNDERGLRLTHLFCSPMRRALQTALPLARALRIQPQVWSAIHEHGGIYLETPEGVVGYPGMTRAEIEESFPDFILPDDITSTGWWNPADGQEPLAEAYARAIRVADELRRMARSEPDARVALITHGTFIDGLIKALLCQLPSRAAFYLHYNTAVTRIDFRLENWLVMHFVNRVDHLSADLIS
jgi:broad specificity phosphatase PhoE